MSMRRCDGTDPFLVKRDDRGEFVKCDCGTVFDDVYTSVVYPHTKLMPLWVHKDKEDVYELYEMYRKSRDQNGDDE